MHLFQVRYEKKFKKIVNKNFYQPFIDLNKWQMALINALLAPYSQLSPIKVNINSFVKQDKRGEYRAGIFFTQHRQNRGEGGREGGANSILSSCNSIVEHLWIRPFQIGTKLTYEFLEQNKSLKHRYKTIKTEKIRNIPCKNRNKILKLGTQLTSELLEQNKYRKTDKNP